MTAPIHILHLGLPLCGFTRDLPVAWPKGHAWVSLLTVKEGFTNPNRCRACWAEAKAKGVTPPP